MMQQNDQEERSMAHEVREIILERAGAFLKWMKPAAADPFWLQAIKLILKMPVFLLVLLLSPVAFIVLVFTFVVVI